VYQRGYPSFHRSGSLPGGSLSLLPLQDRRIDEKILALLAGHGRCEWAESEWRTRRPSGVSCVARLRGAGDGEALLPVAELVRVPTGDQQQAGGTGHTAPAVAGTRRLRPPCAEAAGGLEFSDLWCHVSLPRAGTFSTRSPSSAHHVSDGRRRRAKTPANGGRNGGNIPWDRADLLAASAAKSLRRATEP
jgi:hypothetical protein